jgi:tetratricopeptide (TPR) repeat protein
MLLDSVKLARQAGEKQLLANCLLWSGSSALSLFNVSLAYNSLQEALALLREIGDEWGEAVALLWLSNASLLQGETESARELFSLCLDVAKRQGDPWCLAMPLLSAAQYAFGEGDLDKTQLSLLEAESTLRLVGDKWNLAWAINGLGRVALARNDFATARNYFTEGLEMARENGNKLVLGITFAETAIMIIQENQRESSADAQTRAARLCGAAMPYFDFPGLYRGMGYATLIDQARAKIEDPIWETGVAQGKALSLDQALVSVMQELRSA